MTDSSIPRQVSCDLEDCPISTEGRCLEGFENGADCPHLVTANGDSDDQQVEAGDEADTWVHLGGDDSLSTLEADQLAGEYGATVVLVAGEYESGKTTLLVELYGRFLIGPFCGLKFAGTRTLDAFDKRHFPTRYDSGWQAPTSEHTSDEDMRVLHLRLWNGARHRVLMPTDIKGEFFERVIDGRDVQEEVPIAHRADKTLVLIDGASISDTSRRQQAMQRARLLIGGLTEEGGLQGGRPLAIVLAKQDLLDSESQSWFDENVSALVEQAQNRGAGPVDVIQIAARPDDDPDNPRNLEAILNWIYSTEGLRSPVSPRSVKEDDRVFLHVHIERR